MRSRRSVACAFAAFATLLSVGLLAAAPLVAGHAEFIASTPAPYDIWNVSPTYVSVTVSEAVQPGSPTITVTNSSDARVDSGPVQLSSADPTTFTVHLLSGIGPSVYTVTWSLVSADDGHFTAGTFYFMVSYRNGTLPGTFPQTGTLGVSQPVSPLDVGLQAADFVGFSVAFGGSLLAGLLWIPIGSSLETADRTQVADGLRALLRFARLGAAVFAVAVAGLWAENLILSPPANAAAAVGSVYLLSLASQLALGLVLVILITHVLSRSDPGRILDERPWEFLPILFSGFLIILAEVAASHSATATAWWPLAPIADAIHLYGASLWVGGLLALLRTRGWLKEPAPPEFSVGILRAFSRLALLGAGMVVSAGAILAVVLLGTLDALTGTGYGWVILAKTALLVPMVLLGAWNHRTLGPAVSSEKLGAPTVQRVSRVVRWEAVMGAVVLVMAGLLATMNPAAAPAPSNPTFTLDATSGGLYALFQMNPWPASPGDYIFQLIVYYESNGTAYVQGGNATLSFLLEGGNGTWITLPLEGPHANHYFIDSSVLDAAGTWQLRGEVRGPAGMPVDFPFQVVLHP